MARLAKHRWSLIDLNGTASRTRGLTFLGLFLLALTSVKMVGSSSPDLEGWSFIGLTISVVLLFVALVQRLHDAGHSGYWALLTLVPILGIAAIIVILVLPSGAQFRRGHPVARRIGMAGLLLYAVVGVTRVFLWEAFWVPAESMKPTLLVGDFLIASRVEAEDLQRGDVVAFRHPVAGVYFIKRLIGLPGDTIQVKEGVLYINGTAAPQEPAGVFEEVMEPQGPMGSRPRCENGGVGDGGICKKSIFVETLPNGRQHHVLNISNSTGMPDNTAVYTVPEGHYFVMGDNRDNSTDSRFALSANGVDYLPEEYLIGRADRIMFSAAGSRLFYFWTWRSDRFFKAVE